MHTTTATPSIIELEALAEEALAQMPDEIRAGLSALPLRARLDAIRVFTAALGLPTAYLARALKLLPKPPIHVRETRNHVTGVSTYYVAEWDSRGRSEHRLTTDAKDRRVEQAVLWKADDTVCGLVFTKSGMLRVATAAVAPLITLSEELDRR